jgi:hypothetical protein
VQVCLFVCACQLCFCGCSLSPCVCVENYLSPSASMHISTGKPTSLFESDNPSRSIDTKGHAVYALTQTYTQHSASEIAFYNSQFFPPTGAPSVRPTRVRE